MKIETGKVKDLGKNTKDWFIGNFMPVDSPFNSNDFEVKWIERKAGEIKENLTPPQDNNQKTFVVLIDGEMQFDFADSDEAVILKNKGEYMFFTPTPIHKSTAIKDSTVIVFRWPSKL